MGTSTPGLAHAIATRHPGRVAPDPRGVSVGAPGRRHRAGSPWRPVSWLAGRRRSPGLPGMSGGLTRDRLATYSCGGSHGLGERRTVFPSPPRPELRGALRNASALQARLASAFSEHAKRKRIGSDRDDPSQGVQRQPRFSRTAAGISHGASPDDRPRQGCAADRRRRWPRTRPWDASPRPARRPRVRRGAADRPRPPRRPRDCRCRAPQRRSTGRSAVGAGRGRQLVAAGYARDPHLDVGSSGRCSRAARQPDPWQCFDRSAEPRCQQARHRPGATPARARRPSETHQGDRALSRSCSAPARARRAAAADQDQRRAVRRSDAGNRLRPED